jgi:hypothetical protein
MNHKTFKTIFFIIFTVTVIGFIIQFVVIGYGVTHPEAIGEFFGQIFKGFNSVK